jgi:glycosyltransferase involved in cell wall biosynthesis
MHAKGRIFEARKIQMVNMDVILCQPYLDGMGGVERVSLELAKKFNCKIYTMRYEKGKTYREFADFEIETIKPSLASRPFGFVGGFDTDIRARLTASAGLTMLGLKLKDDYDVLSAHLSPSEWLRNRNPRMCWYCHGPNGAFDASTGFYKIMFKERQPHQRIFLRAGFAAYRAVELALITPKIEKICACSEFTREKIKSSLGRDDAEVIHPPVRPDDFTCSEYGKYFLHTSRIVPEKQFEYTIEAFKRFNRGKEWKMVIAGHMYANRRNQEYLGKLKRLACDSNIIFEIDAPDKRIRELYSGCYAYLFSSIDEDWGIVILEAMASSKPVISINKGGPTISVLDGKTGFLVNSPDEMAKKMRFLAEHPGICEKLGKAGRKRVEQNYTWRIFLDRMKKVFKDTANARTE